MSSGTVKESYLSEVYSKESEENQSSIMEFTDSTDDSPNSLGTTVAVVSDPIGGITDVCDEFRGELGMPNAVLDEFRELRESLEESGADSDVQAHNAAVDELNLREEYVSYIQSNSAAKDSIAELAERVQLGETITLVCFESRDKWCHRHVLKEEIVQYTNK